MTYAGVSDHPLAAVMAGLSVGGERERLHQSVFRPSHILPTYTIEQAGEPAALRLSGWCDGIG
eukprot:scaffold3464_cov406-Prasinococcus_capsulatus_cf.AAC.14